MTRALLLGGTPISEINIVRAQRSAINGGQLAMAITPARVATLVISDVPDNNPAWVASGPTIPNCTIPADALAILERYAIDIPPPVQTWLNRRRPADGHNTPSADHTVAIIATAAAALGAARQAAESAGVDVCMLGDALEGEARELGRAHGLLARRIKAAGIDRPLLLLSGGETSVTVGGRGRGGRNTEYLRDLALDGAPGIHALAADTGGIDGSEDNAGALLRPDTLLRAREAGVDISTCLTRNDAYGLFEATGDLLVTGPTRTNVNDFRAMLIQP